MGLELPPLSRARALDIFSIPSSYVNARNKFRRWTAPTNPILLFTRDVRSLYYSVFLYVHASIYPFICTAFYVARSGKNAVKD